jgi:hypothetical protein
VQPEAKKTLDHPYSTHRDPYKVTGNIRTELKTRAANFKERDINPDTYKKSRYAFRQTIKQAKLQYRTKIESFYTGSDACRMRHGLQTITDLQMET